MVKDMDRAVRFYTKTLGLPLVVRYGGDWAEVDAGSTRIGLHPTDGKIAAGGGTASFYVDDLAGLAKRSEEHTSELQSRRDLVCRLLLEKKKKKKQRSYI